MGVTDGNRSATGSTEYLAIERMDDSAQYVRSSLQKGIDQFERYLYKKPSVATDNTVMEAEGGIEPPYTALQAAA